MITASLLLGLGGLVMIPPVDTVTTAPVETDPPPVVVAGEPGSTDTLDSGNAPTAQPPAAPLDDNYLPGPVDFITNLPGDWVEWGEGSIRVSNVPVVAGLGIGTAGLVQIDEEGYRVMRKEYERSRDFRRSCDVAVFIGDGKFQLGVAALFGVFGFVADDHRAIRTASQMMEVIIACGGVVQLVKHLTGRQRPSDATSPTGHWSILPDPVEYHRHVPRYDAFPSGHMSTATAALTVIMENYPEASWLPWIGYPALGALGIGLVSSGMHWWSDFPLAIALGYSFGHLVGGRRSDKRASTDMGIHDRGAHGPTPGIALLSDGSPALGIIWSW